MRFVRQKQEYWYVLGATVLAMVLLGVYGIQLSGTVINDETTVMANTAWMMGKDWNLMVDALGGYYYRYGEAILTLPIFLIFKDPAMAYRMSMLLHAVLHALIIPVVYVICRRHLKLASARFSLLAGLAVCFIPSAALYVFYYRGDFLLGILPWYVLLFFLETIRSVQENRRIRRILFTILAIVFSLAAYMAHTRGIVVAIALFAAALLMRLFMKEKSLDWPFLLAVLAILAVIDAFTGKYFEQAVYSISGLKKNSLSSVNLADYFYIFSYKNLKDIVMLSVSWMYTLIVTTGGLTLIGLVGFFAVFYQAVFRKGESLQTGEKAAALFGFLIFAGYFATGALFFKGTYLALASGTLKRRSDRLLYDRYTISGAGFAVFFALYLLCCRSRVLSKGWKWLTALLTVGITGLWCWKIYPIASRIKAYVYNTITLNTFRSGSSTENVMGDIFYQRKTLLLSGALGFLIFAVILWLAWQRKKRKNWIGWIMAVVLVSDLVLIQVNYTKIRKSSNDYFEKNTADVVEFLDGLSEEIVDAYPYVLKKGVSGIGISYYQSRLPEYKFIGVTQVDKLQADNFFLINAKDKINEAWNEGDYYFFEDYDYENAAHDIVLVKGEELSGALEKAGYHMVKYAVP